MQYSGRNMTLMRAASAGRCLYRPSVCASHHFYVGVPSQVLRKPLHLAPFTTGFLQIPSVLKAVATRWYSVKLDDIKFEQVSDETLESLSEYLEELIASEAAPQDCDVLYSTGVLTLQLGTFGTYVINKQTPNKQIWLSSPISGPKRFDFLAGVWVYRHTGETLHDLLNEELSRVFSSHIDFISCAFGRAKTN